MLRQWPTVLSTGFLHEKWLIEYLVRDSIFGGKVQNNSWNQINVLFCCCDGHLVKNLCGVTNCEPIFDPFWRFGNRNHSWKYSRDVKQEIVFCVILLYSKPQVAKMTCGRPSFACGACLICFLHCRLTFFKPQNVHFHDASALAAFWDRRFNRVCFYMDEQTVQYHNLA